MTAQRFCLRSQHYCHNRNKNIKNPKPFIQRANFIPNMRNPRAVSIATSHDKNNPNLEHMERVVYCTCGKSRWTCYVHFAKRFLQAHPLPPYAALVQCKSGDMYYSAMLNIVKNW